MKTLRNVIHVFRSILVALTIAAISLMLYACAPLPPIGPDDNPPEGSVTIPPDEDPEDPDLPDDPDGSDEPDDPNDSESGGNNKPDVPDYPTEPDPPEPQEPWQSEYGLPSAESAKARLVEIYGGADKMFLLNANTVARMPCPRGETVKLNMTFSVSAYAKTVLEDSVDEFNDVFAVINPHYRFEINYAPTDADFSAKYSVRMRTEAQLSQTETSQVFGFAHVGYYNGFTELGDFAITIRTDVFDNGAYLMTTFKHELMHLLGAGDAYKNANATQNTIMQSYKVNASHGFSSTDVAMLDAMYRNPASPHSDEYIADYIENYETNSTHTRRALTAVVYKQMINELDGDEIVSQTNAIGYKDTAAFASLVNGGAKRDETFGCARVSFTELEYVTRPEITYFGGFDPTTGKYSHGKQKPTIGSSQNINYTDYGDGLLYAAPDGNLYTLFVRIGDYVVLFTLHGSFTDLPALGATVWHVCAINN
ncbi:MAG: hypothetical protein OSJ83_07390 [Clostridia bacterium]|nr:hypothetical protein [Clostridia bacterium]